MPPGLFRRDCQTLEYVLSLCPVCDAALSGGTQAWQLLLRVGASAARLLLTVLGLLAGHLLAPCPGVHLRPWSVLNF